MNSSKEHIYKRIPWRLVVVMAVLIPPGLLSLTGFSEVPRGPVIFTVCIMVYIIFWILRRDWHKKNPDQSK